MSPSPSSSAPGLAAGATVARAAPGPAQATIEQFLSAVATSLAQGSFSRLVLAKYHGAQSELQQLQVRRLQLRGVASLSLVQRFRTRDVTTNLPEAQALDMLRGALAADGFRNAHLHTATHEVQLSISKRGQATLRSTPVQHDVDAAAGHDREKQRWVGLDRPFLAALGVTTASHELIPAMARKWRQINKFVEVFAHALESARLAEARSLRVLDFGSGKGYLTFAVHDHLRRVRGVEARVTGVELRPELVRLCNDVVAQLGLEGLDFEAGDVRQHAAQAVDVMIALHACDTATDHAIEFGVRTGARIILCAPCCHKEVRPQLMSPQPLRAILQHGVHLGQEAEMVTDGLRALLLEACGYATQVFEFVSLEHTSKNKMILAVKREQPGAAAPVLEQVDEVKRFYGIREQCLERLLRERLALPAA
jgi:SAM-dependent methyltransferase